LSAAGTISKGSFTETSKNTYSVSSNCTGTLTFKDGDFSPANYNIVLDDNKMGFQMIQTDTDTNQPGFGLAQGNADCGLTGKAQNFATNFLTLFLSGYESTVGQITLNGKGKLSGEETVAVQGTIYDMIPVSGKYSENAECTGTVEITPDNSNLTTMHFNMVVVNAGKELLLIETDPDTLVAGTAQQ
jgi:hypothetical protein